MPHMSGGPFGQPTKDRNREMSTLQIVQSHGLPQEVFRQLPTIRRKAMSDDLVHRTVVGIGFHKPSVYPSADSTRRSNKPSQHTLHSTKRNLNCFLFEYTLTWMGLLTSRPLEHALHKALDTRFPFVHHRVEDGKR